MYWNETHWCRLSAYVSERVTEYDNSPLDCVTKQTGAGAAWHTTGKGEISLLLYKKVWEHLYRKIFISREQHRTVLMSMIWTEIWKKDSRKSLTFNYNALNLLDVVKENNAVKASYRYLVNGTKISVRNGNGNTGYDYKGSFVYTVTNSTPALEAAHFTESQLEAMGVIL